MPRVNARPAAAGEGGSLIFVVTLDAAAAGSVYVSYRLASGSAQAGADNDYRDQSATLIFRPGQTQQELRVALVDDARVEGAELLWLELTGAVNATVAQRFTPGLVYDSDRPGGTAAFSVSDAVADEADRTVTFFVRLSQPADHVTRVAWATHDDTARAGTDYHAASGTLSFAPGETVKAVTVDLIDDGLAEADEFFALQLSDAQGAVLADAVAAAEIGRSDGHRVALPEVSSQRIVVGEADGAARFVVQLSAASDSEVRVGYALQDASATGHGDNADYLARDSTLVFAPGETTKTVTVALVDDARPEGDETFLLHLVDAVNATVRDAQNSATIVDDDGAGVLSSGGLGNDRYRVDLAGERIVESPGGGIDTVLASVSYTLPEEVENLVLAAGSAASTATGNSGPNQFRGNAADNLFDGRGGIDTVVFSGEAGRYSVRAGDGGYEVVSTAEGVDSLRGIERLQFSDVVWASDTSPGGHVWGAWALFNAAFDRAPDRSELSRWTAELDRSADLRSTAQSMINAYAPGVSDEAFVRQLWASVLERPMEADSLAVALGQLASGVHTQASLLELVATLPINTDEFATLVGQTAMLDAAWFAVPGV